MPLPALPPPGSDQTERSGMPLPALPPDLIDEIIIRFPPAEPELLVRASLVCKRWCRLISDPAFRRRLRELHRAPPMLGVFYTRHLVSSFVPTSSVPVPHAMRGNWRAIESRHGRVLLHTFCWGNDLPTWSAGDLLVWDPITDEQWTLPKLPVKLFARLPCSWTAAVLCAAADGICDHIDCHSGGSFLVVFVCTAPRETFTCVYSSETGAWSEPTSAALRRAWVRLSFPSILVGNTLYFISAHSRTSKKILEHDMETEETSLIRLPRTNYVRIALAKMVDGRLGFAGVSQSKLYLWSREAGSEKYAGWAQSRVIDLETLLRPSGTLMASLVICFVDGVAAFFMGTDGLVFAIDLKAGRITKIGDRMAHNIVPYMSFYTPALVAAATGEGPRAGAPSA